MSSKEKSSKSDREKNQDIFSRYFIITAFLSLLAFAILGSAFHIGIGEQKEWLKVQERHKSPNQLTSPIRGNIYSDDDRLMTVNVPKYYLFMDFSAEGFALDSFMNSKRNNVDSLAWHLSKKLKNRTPAGYKAHLLKGLKEKDRRYRVYNARVSDSDLREIRSFPFLRFHRNNSGFYAETIMERQKPFGTLASRTVGDIYGKIDSSKLTHGKNGLEMQYDSLLHGMPGISSIISMGKRSTTINLRDPVNGLDIRSTININIQDLVDKALTDKLKELDADVGTAVVMEVKTGEIKAITNMVKVGPGQYDETMNHAVADVVEPGSTFKVASMMVALEDGIVKPTTPVDVGNGIYPYADEHITDHNANHGGYGMISAEKAIWYSSNIGVAKLILKGYEQHPKKFLDGLRRIGMDTNLRLEIPGYGKAKLRWPGDHNWSRMSLPWISFGYEVQISPIQTLAFFNAIANEGKMMRPMLAKDIMKNGKVVKHFEPQVLIPEICSKPTLKMVQNMLYNVVNYKDPTPARRDGTGKPACSETITIAGKTGTAQIASRGVYKTAGHYVSFCGYFPYENPLYTCIVTITRPRVGPASGGQMCGTVVKEIAEKIYAYCTIADLKELPDNLPKATCPTVKHGDYAALKHLLKEFNIKTNGAEKVKTKYVTAHGNDQKGITIKEQTQSETLVPNVEGMGAKDAVYAMENCGLRVTLAGKGRVTAQSVKPGSHVTTKQTVTLTLKE